MSKLYRAKTIQDGFKLGLKNPDKYVGVPAGRGYTHAAVLIEGTPIEVELSKKAYEETFPDKFGRGTYTLEYFKISQEV